MKDEDYAYETQRQKRIDNMKEPKFGGAIPKDLWIQRTVKESPVSFRWAHKAQPPMPWYVRLFWLTYVIAILSLVLWAGSVKAEMLSNAPHIYMQQEQMRQNQEIMIQQQQQMLQQQRRQQNSYQPYVMEKADPGYFILKGLRDYEENKR